MNKKILLTAFLTAFAGAGYTQEIMTQDVLDVRDIQISVADVRGTDEYNSGPAFKEPGFEVYSSYKDYDVCVVRKKNASYDSPRYALARYSDGKMLTSVLFTDLSKVSDADIFTAALNRNYYGIIDKTGKVITPFIYNNISSFSVGNEKFFVVKKNSKYGIINAKNQLIKPIEYDALDSYSKGLVYAVKDCKTVVPFDYDFIVEMQDKSLMGYNKAKGFEKINF